jgi:cell wall-associated NlpC family hydrolase
MTVCRRAPAACRLLLLAALLALALGACGAGTSTPRGRAHAALSASLAPGATRTAGGDPPGASRTGARMHEVADPDEADSYPAPATVKHAAAATPAKAGSLVLAAGALSNAEVARELDQTQAAQHRAERAQAAKLLTPVPGGESIGGNGALPIPANVPEVVQRVIAGANEIADFPYVFGGGHASFVDDAYDCSGSVSYALAAGGLLERPEVSGELEHWGVPGPGRYITVFANAGHTYMYIDGILYDTAGRSGVYASRWQVAPTDNAGYVERHWPGY